MSLLQAHSLQSLLAVQLHVLSLPLECSNAGGIQVIQCFPMHPRQACLDLSPSTKMLVVLSSLTDQLSAGEMQHSSLVATCPRRVHSRPSPLVIPMHVPSMLLDVLSVGAPLVNWLAMCPQDALSRPSLLAMLPHVPSKNWLHKPLYSFEILMHSSTTSRAIASCLFAQPG